MLTYNDRKYETLDNPRLIVDASKGATIWRAVRDAMRMALDNDTEVVLVFNGKSYTVNPTFLEGIVVDGGPLTGERP